VFFGGQGLGGGVQGQQQHVIVNRRRQETRTTRRAQASPTEFTARVYCPSVLLTWLHVAHEAVHVAARVPCARWVVRGVVVLSCIQEEACSHRLEHLQGGGAVEAAAQATRHIRCAL
jgi:hypothetical protein